MNNKRQDMSIPPSGLYLAFNGAAGVLYALALPVGVALLLGLPAWAIVVITVVWAVLNGRVVDRHIPALTDPIIRWVWHSHENRKSKRGIAEPESGHVRK